MFFFTLTPLYLFVSFLWFIIILLPSNPFLIICKYIVLFHTSQHTATCSGRRGMYLSLRTCAVYLVRDVREERWGTLYLDGTFAVCCFFFFLLSLVNYTIALLFIISPITCIVEQKVLTLFLIPFVFILHPL